MSALKGMNIHSNLRQAGESIRIGFIGYVRYFERNKQMLDVFANDERFELHYYGTGADILKKYADENGIKNTVFHDSFPVEDTKKYLEKIDIINNLYGNDSLNVRNAVSIKFFHALYAKIPILVCDNTYVGTLAKDLGMGFEVCEINCSMKENLYDWYTSLNFQNLSSACDRFLQKAMYENEVLEDVFMECLNDKSPDK